MPGLVAHQVGFATIGALRNVHFLRQQAALRIDPQRVSAVPWQQEAARVRLHPGFLVTALRGVGTQGAVTRLNLATPSLHAMVRKVTVEFSVLASLLAAAQSPVRVSLENHDLREGPGGRASSQNTGLVVV